MHDQGTEYSDLARLLSFCVSFPVSEAIVESWGSSITHLYSLKHNPKEYQDDVAETGTVDKMTFIKLNGSPPGMMNNREMLKRALNDCYKSDNALHFIDQTKFKNSVTSKVVTRILDPKVEAILPCYI